MSDDPPVVLVVEDEPDLADLYAAWLGGDYAVRTAYGGEEAIEELDESVDVVLLDRRMPGLSGDEVLVAVRDRGIDCRVAMVTAVEPDFDIVAMGFDDYLVKPVTREALADTVENLARRNEYDSGVQELYALASKKAVLESEKGRAALADSDEFRDLDERLSRLREELDEQVDELDEHDDFEGAFRDLSDGEDDDDEPEFDF
ncbi:response regulator transcription factor [Candidatus Halobonum tyrrellensis]|uniref:HoxA-like transcriptional regulator n=1 Tax=Candidatus Halobonum tyrrellensis G22 TaxID=1324957 RepID=V4J150_9EURY|nr:HalX domain-containing protein [Candidatus Halobonum tyrrellensis]ESP89177.1 HoxA-like transcriptional regulator [Candidatus Halobonum tyrrellensis G22]